MGCSLVGGGIGAALCGLGDGSRADVDIVKFVVVHSGTLEDISTEGVG